MKNEFVPYDIALAMTQVGWGWHEGVMGWYCNTTQELRRDDNLPVGVIYAPLYQQALNFLYSASNGKINISINGEETNEERDKKFRQAIEDLRNLQNNKP